MPNKGNNGSHVTVTLDLETRSRLTRRASLRGLSLSTYIRLYLSKKISY